jgi:anaerobic selenocysteine-containing dehydrogenase
VTVEDGRATKVTGDRDDPLYGGYTCIKGRSQRRHDVEFLAENSDGLGRLAEVLQPYTAELVAERAGIQAEHIVETARTLAGARRGFVWSGTGPSMAGSGTLAEYLVLVLTALCGFFPRTGDVTSRMACRSATGWACRMPTTRPQSSTSRPAPSRSRSPSAGTQPRQVAGPVFAPGSSLFSAR